MKYFEDVNELILYVTVKQFKNNMLYCADESILLEMYEDFNYTIENYKELRPYQNQIINKLCQIHLTKK